VKISPFENSSFTKPSLQNGAFMFTKSEIDELRAAFHELTSIELCAARLGLSRQALSEQSRLTGFPVHLINGKRRVSASEVRAWRESNVRLRRRRDE
jgi:hypothetical protein